MIPLMKLQEEEHSAELAIPEIDVCREAKLLESPLLVVVVPVKLDKAVDILDTSDAIVEA